MDIKTGFGAALLGGVAFAALTVWSGSFVLDQTERGYITRMGQVVNRDHILGPGLHFKWPYVEHVDTMVVSRNSFPVKDLKIITKDNQVVTFDFTVLYETPDEAVYGLLYNLGKSGNVDITHNIEAMIRDRVGRIISPQNAINLANDRDVTTNRVLEEVRKEVSAVYGLRIIDVQMSKMEFDDRFLESVKAAANEKAKAQQEMNIVAQKEAVAAQQIAVARGEAESNAIRAEGAKRAAIAEAEGKAQAVLLVAKAQNEALRLQGEIIKASPGLVDFEWARHWTGSVPATVVNGGATPVLGLPGLTGTK